MLERASAAMTLYNYAEVFCNDLDIVAAVSTEAAKTRCGPARQSTASEIAPASGLRIIREGRY